MEYKELSEVERITWNLFIKDKPTLRKELFDWLKSKELTVCEATYLLGNMQDYINETFNHSKLSTLL